MAHTDDIEDWIKSHESAYNELKRLVDELYSGNLSPALREHLTNWLNKYGVDLIGNLVKAVFFELTDAGYFVANIPDSWDAILFNTTGLDIFLPDYDYGHLVLSY
jgi:hypothetical protein